MYFQYKITDNCPEGFFSLYKDSSFYSLIYSKPLGDFTILLGGDWRLEISVDSRTGKCICFQGNMVGNIKELNLNIPSSRKGDLFFRYQNYIAGTGCHYLSIIDNIYYDSKEKIVCIGNPLTEGIAIEFTENTIVVLSDDKLVAVYLKLINLPELTKFN